MKLMVLGVHYYKSCNYSPVKEHSVNDALSLFPVYDVLALITSSAGRNLKNYFEKQPPY